MQDLFQDPVVVSSGFTYEKEMILATIKNSGGIDPNTRKNIAGDPIVPNRCLERAIEEYKSQNNVKMDQSNEQDVTKIKF